jgi:hypothetical protein
MTRLTDANRYEMKCENGILLGYRLPQMRELVVARLLPFAVLDAAQAALDEGKKPEEAAAVVNKSVEERLREYGDDYEAQQRIVASMILSVDNEPASLTLEETRDIPEESFMELVAIALRAKAPGGAEGEA